MSEVSWTLPLRSCFFSLVLQQLVDGYMKTVMVIMMVIMLETVASLFLIDVCRNTHIHSAASGP